MTVSSATIASSFGRAAQRYRRHARVQYAMAAWLAEWLPPVPDRTGRVLELGAGPGVFTEKLLPWAGPLLATDLSPEMCAEGARHLPQLDWRSAAAEEPPAGPWDWICSCSMLQWVEEPAATLAACRAELAPGGRFLGGLFAAPTIAEWSALAPEAAPIAWRSEGEWTAAIRAAGLGLARCEACTFAFDFPSSLDFVRSLHAVGAAPARRVAPGRLAALLRDYEARHRSPAGVRSTWTFFRFEATRSPFSS